MRVRANRERGVTVVEAAFALPILFLFMFGLVDLGMWTFNANQATNAAREGARVGILDYRTAHEAGPARDAIEQKVRAKLPDADIEIVDVSCVDPAGNPLGLTGACTNARVDVDRIRVEVRRTWHLLTPLAALIGVADGETTGTAMMTIVGSPLSPDSVPDEDISDDETEGGGDGGSGDDSTTLTPCVPTSITTLTVSPDPISRPQGSDDKQLAGTLTISFTADPGADCRNVRIEIDTTGPGTHATTLHATCGCGEGPNFSYPYVGSDNNWGHGQGQVRLLKGDTELRSVNFFVN